MKTMPMKNQSACRSYCDCPVKQKNGCCIIASTAKQRPVLPRPPPPLTTCRTVAHVVSQLENQVQHHTGYVPKNSVQIALFHYFDQEQAKRTQNIGASNKFSSFWNYFRRSLHDPSSNAKYKEIIVRRLDESEW
jgi:hypothetical protein